MSGWARFAAVAFAALVGCAAEPVPDALLGVWRTAAPGYGDRFLRVASDSVAFGTGGDGSSSHLLEDVEVTPLGEGRLRCVLHYALRDGAAAQLRLVLEPGPPPTLRFENREEAWHRDQRRLARGGAE